MFAWPGVIPDYFGERQPEESVDPVRFLAAWARMALGAASIVMLAIYAPHLRHSLGLARGLQHHCVVRVGRVIASADPRASSA